MLAAFAMTDCTALGRLYADGNGVAKDRTKAVKLCATACNANEPTSCWARRSCRRTAARCLANGEPKGAHKTKCEMLIGADSVTGFRPKDRASIDSYGNDSPGPIPY